MSEIKIWEEYLQKFGLEQNDIRKGCEPCFIVNDELKDNAIVLIHGLTDSPFFMKAIGQYFHDVMGFNVFIPLLAGHGLNQPDGMRTVTLGQWENNVKYAVESAKKYAQKISIGGLSTGGALSVHQALESEGGISGGIFLFSAALDLTGQYGHLEGELKEFFLRLTIAQNFADITDSKGKDPLIGDHPYRYAAIDIHGAIQLEKLIQELDRKIEKATLLQPVFAAHSKVDQTARMEGVERLLERCQTHGLFVMFVIPDASNVSHASVVLQDDIPGNNKKTLEEKNPFFREMMETAHQFAINTLENVRNAP